MNENGWKFLTWGMNEEQVREAVSTNGFSYDGSDNKQHWFWYGFDENWNLKLFDISKLPDPSQLKWVRSGIEETDLLFYEDRLFGVVIGKRKTEEYIGKLFTTMSSRYPTGKMHKVSDTNMQYFEHQTGHRIIVWQSNSREFGLSFYDIAMIQHLLEISTLAATTMATGPGGEAGQPAPGAGSTPSGGSQTWTEPTTGMEFVWIPGGCFTMGQTEAGTSQLLSTVGQERYQGQYATELPRHEVCVDGFWIGRYEVTNRQYGFFNSRHDSGYLLNMDEQPVANVSWGQASDFADWLGAANQGRVFSLPSEAQWEYAARANTSTIRYWGDSPDQACTYGNVGDFAAQNNNIDVGVPHICNDSYIVTAPVGSFQPNRFGLYDMMGNVTEWCLDFFGDYTTVLAQKNNPVNQTGDGFLRAVRGGSWTSQPANVRSAFHAGADPRQGNKAIGFRLIMTVE